MPGTNMRQDNRNNMVSFRLNDAEYSSMNEIFQHEPVVGANSVNQIARKIVCDYLAGRLVYKSKSDKSRDFNRHILHALENSNTDCPG